MINNSFSIIVPVYNTKKEFLCECLDSLNKQDYDNYEIIIVDDGSNEETKQLLKNCNNKHTIIINQINQGQHLSRINGVKASNNDYILYVDSDDVVADDYLITLNKLINEYKVDVVMFASSRFKQLGNYVSTTKYFKEGIVDKKNIIAELVKIHISEVWSKCARRELINTDINKFDSSLRIGEDYGQSTDLILKANSFYYTEKQLYFYRINEEYRNYYDITNIKEVNFMIPPYNIIFKDNDKYKDLLGIFKLSSINAVIDKAFRICRTNNSYSKKKEFLNELNKQEALTLLSSMKEKISLPSQIVFDLLRKKFYFLIYIFAQVSNRDTHVIYKTND